MKAAIVFPLILGIVLLSNKPGISQNVIPGITAGASLNPMNLNMDQIPTELSDLNGVEAGFFLSFSTKLVYVRPTVVASYLRGTVTSRIDGVQIAESKFQLTTIETPVFLGLKLLPGISIEAGPSWNYLLNYTETINGVNVDLNRHSFGYRGGLRATFSRLGAFAHYGGIVNQNEKSKIQLDRPSRFIFGVTFDLVSKN